MSAEMAQKLVQGGIKAVRSGDHALARKAFTGALKLDPNNEAAWLGMATITEGADDKLRILNRVLEINPDNERAAEAIRRLGGIQDLAEEEEAVPEPELEAEPEIFAEPELESEPEPQMDKEDLVASGEIAILQDIEPGDTGELSDFPKPDWSLDEDVPGVDDQPTGEHLLLVRSSDEVFASMPQLPTQGRGGIPVPDRNAIENTSQVIEADVQAYLEESLVDYLTPDVAWTQKTGGRAGSTEYRIFLLQASVASFVGLVVVASALIFTVLTNPTLTRILLPPTIVPTHTPTNTPTATPGVTNTPSPTPPVPATETPSLPNRIVLGFDDPNFPPTPTEIYYRVQSETELLNNALNFMQAGELDDARTVIDEAVDREEETGAIPPTLRLSEWHLLNDNPSEARQVLDDWLERWGENNIFDRNESSFLLGQARVDVYEVSNGSGDRFFLLDQAQNRLESSLGISQNNRIADPDGSNPDGYTLLADVFVLRGNPDVAVQVLDNALDVQFSNRSLLEDNKLRMKKVEILIGARRYAEAFQELYYVLQINPFHQEALILQSELALETGQSGLGVLYSQQYLLYYPGSLQGFYLLGQSREAESKFDLALNAYSRAVAGDRTDENYTSDPFFLSNLLARAELFTRQGFQDEASQDFSDALEFAENDPALLIRRLQADYATGDYESALLFVEELLGASGVNQAEVLYFQALTLIALADDGDFAGDYSDAADALSSALARNLPSNLRSNAQENLAWASLQARSYGDALSAIDDAIDLNSSAYRRYLRGLILQGQGNSEEAILDFEYIVTWGQYYNFPFYEDARTAYDRLGGR